jgi:hypothetical protein
VLLRPRNECSGGSWEELGLLTLCGSRLCPQPTLGPGVELALKLGVILLPEAQRCTSARPHGAWP